jgi:hypothetical protein
MTVTKHYQIDLFQAISKIVVCHFYLELSPKD